MIELVAVVTRIHSRIDRGRVYRCRKKKGDFCLVENDSGRWIEVPSSWFRLNLSRKAIDDILNDMFVKSDNF